jgi:hypothetical protein
LSNERTPDPSESGSSYTPPDTISFKLTELEKLCDAYKKLGQVRDKRQKI